MTVICEINARRWKAWGRSDVASAFKGAAHLCLASMKRWQRPSGELWIVKNRADPAERLGYEGYSFHSQYNLLPAAMIAMAYEHADDNIAPGQVPSERSSYVFDVRKIFHKVCAAHAGLYALIDTGADDHYNATGLLRVHRSGVDISPLSDNTALHRAYQPTAGTHAAIAPGLAWRTVDGEWESLSDFSRPGGNSTPRSRTVTEVELTVHRQDAGGVDFTLISTLNAGPVRMVEDRYEMQGETVTLGTRLVGDAVPAERRAIFPALVSDGAHDTIVQMEAGLSIESAGRRLTWKIKTPESGAATLEGERIPCRNGHMRLATVALKDGVEPVIQEIRLERT